MRNFALLVSPHRIAVFHVFRADLLHPLITQASQFHVRAKRTPLLLAAALESVLANITEETLDAFISWGHQFHLMTAPSLETRIHLGL